MREILMRVYSLTERQAENADLLWQGLNDYEISKRTGKTIKSIKCLNTQVYKRLGLKSRPMGIKGKREELIVFLNNEKVLGRLRA